MSVSDYQDYAEKVAGFLSETLSETSGMALKFNGYSRGSNIFIETADVPTTKWAAIKNPNNQLGSDYAAIRRSMYGNKPDYKICNFVIPNSIAHPDYPEFLKPVDAWLQVNPNVISDLIATNEIWVGEHPWKATEDSPNIDDETEYQKDYSWKNSPWFQKNYRHLSNG